MGRLAYMPAFACTKIRTILLAIALLCSSCADLGSPVTIADRPLSERLADQRSSTSIPEAGDRPEETPEAIAFNEALASGNFIRMNVNTNGVNTPLRSGPGASYSELTALPDGIEVLATGDQTGEWLYVVYGDLEGWVSNRRLQFGSGTDQEAVVTARDLNNQVVYEVYNNAVGVNIRATPNANGRLVTGAPTGAEVTGTGNVEGSWIEITYNGNTGWASGNYLRPVTG